MTFASDSMRCPSRLLLIMLQPYERMPLLSDLVDDQTRKISLSCFLRNSCRFSGSPKRGCFLTHIPCFMSCCSISSVWTSDRPENDVMLDCLASRAWRAASHSSCRSADDPSDVCVRFLRERSGSRAKRVLESREKADGEKTGRENAEVLEVG